MIEKMHERTNGPVFKIIFALVSLSFVLGGIGGTLIGNDTSAVKVNGEEISQQAFSNAKGQQQQQLNAQLGAKFWEQLDNPEYVAQFNQAVLNGLVDNELLRQYAKSLKLDVSADQIKAQIVNDPTFQQDGKFSNELYQQALRNSGVSADRYASLVAEGMLFSQIQEGVINTEFMVPAQQAQLAELLLQQRQVRLATYPLAKEMPNQTASAEEIQAYYDAHKAELIEPEKLKVEYVSFTPKAVEASLNITDEQIQTYYDANKARYSVPAESHIAHIQVASLEEAQKIEQALKGGADFAKEAEKSTDTLSAKNGGDLGWAKAGTFPAAFEKAADALQVGQVSEPVEVDGVYHIIKLLERKPEQLLPMAQVKAQIEQTLRQELALTDYSNIAREMANKAFETSSSLTEVAKLGGVEVQQTALFTRENVPAALNNDKVLKVLFEGDLRQNGQNSDALDVSDEAHSETMFVRVSEYQAERPKTIEEAKAQIERIIQRDKAEKVLVAQAEEAVKALNAGQTANVSFAPSQTLVYAQAIMQQPVLAKTVFAMPKPADKAIYQMARTQQGDVIIVALDKITNGNLNEAKPFIAQLERADQSLLQNNLLNDLRMRASIEVNQNFLDQTNSQN